MVKATSRKSTAVSAQRMLLVATLLLLFVVFVQNLDPVRVRIGLVSLDVPLAIVLIALWGIGFLSGWVFRVVRASERQRHGWS